MTREKSRILIASVHEICLICVWKDFTHIFHTHQLWLLLQLFGCVLQNLFAHCLPKPERNWDFNLKKIRTFAILTVECVCVCLCRCTTTEQSRSKRVFYVYVTCAQCVFEACIAACQTISIFICFSLLFAFKSVHYKFLINRARICSNTCTFSTRSSQLKKI